MNTTLPDTFTMPRGRATETKEPRERFDLRVDHGWIARVAAQAERLGMSASDYVRQAVVRALERDEADEVPAPRRKRGRA